MQPTVRCGESPAGALRQIITVGGLGAHRKQYRVNERLWSLLSNRALGYCRHTVIGGGLHQTPVTVDLRIQCEQKIGANKKDQRK